MKTMKEDNNITEKHVEIRNGFSVDKFDLISTPSQSFSETDASLQSLFGAYQSEETSEEIIAALRNSRTSNRNIESL